ncbi:hypothetical protein DTO166G4_6034 [Paecilomyces variotii]|nr:hypothetical protein DTO032I3_3801 [Paecilomyces variotii]KAJ9212403.1 hypothetical protein DTO166G4_6034 [Paecilomyces variotii]KAJ9225992.1 hypothetical protein DTO169C6_1631 [Paecilomyces variotii]KAJ9241152.1 hypothetical protein DTO166G5_1314 [Paecilomyces variotii]KAJ9260902.1 hypothetical protein DTO207G8_52 [Paecilomyces variotii]
MHLISLMLTAGLASMPIIAAYPTNNFTIRADDASEQSWPNEQAPPQANPPGLDDCYWDGHWPFCMSKCGYGYKKVKQDECGDGHCCWLGKKTLCCIIPPGSAAE